MTENRFLGIRQYTKETFDSLSDEEKIHYINFVRDYEKLESGEKCKILSAEIYLGTRLYANDSRDIDCGDF